MNLSQQPTNLGIFVCGHLFRMDRPIRYVIRDFAGEVSMVCGEDDCDVNDVKNCKLVGLGHMLDYEPKLRDIESLSVGFEAYSVPEGGWALTPLHREQGRGEKDLE